MPGKDYTSDNYSKLNQIVNPTFQVLRPISPIAWIPVSVILFGVGDRTAVFLIFLCSFFPILVACIDGVSNVPSVYRRAGRNFGLTPAQLLANDTDAVGGPLTAELVSGPDAAAGTVTVDGAGNFVFTPAAGFRGAAAFTYRVRDGLGGSDTATVTVTVNPAPVPR